MQRVKLCVVLLALGLGWHGLPDQGFCADYNQHENFGVKQSGDVISFTNTPPGRVLTGDNISDGGFSWDKIDGDPARWMGTIPDNYAGLHSGLFRGTYQPEGGPGGAPHVFTWETDTRAKVGGEYRVVVSHNGLILGEVLEGTRVDVKSYMDETPVESYWWAYGSIYSGGGYGSAVGSNTCEIKVECENLGEYFIVPVWVWGEWRFGIPQALWCGGWWYGGDLIHVHSCSPGDWYDWNKYGKCTCIKIIKPYVMIRSIDGQDPQAYVAPNQTVSYRAVVLPENVAGKFRWSTTSDKIQITGGAEGQQVTLQAGSNVSDHVGAEELKVEFTPEETETKYTYTASHYITVVIKVEIEEPDGLPVQTVVAPDKRTRLNPSCFEWQFVHVDNEKVAYHTTQPIDGLVQPIPPASYNWSVSAGTLNNPTTETPTYVPNSMPIPATMTTVDLKLRAIAENDICMTNRTLEIYRDHLERDFQNWGTEIDCGAQTAYVYYWSYSRYERSWYLLHSWNCFGSVWHAFDGTHDGYTTDLPSSGFTVTTYDDPIPWSTAVANLQRGDIVSFYTYDSGTGTETIQHAHTCKGSSSQMYGANNQPIYGVYSRSDGYGHSSPVWEGGSWRWWITSSETYYDQLNAGYQSMHPGAGKLINRIKVHRR